MNSKKIWPYLDLTIDAADLDSYLNICREHSSCGLQEEFPQKNWCRVFFTEHEACHAAKRAMQNLADFQNDSLKTKVGSIVDSGWNTQWHKFFKPVKAGNKFLILPDWEPEHSTDRCVIRIKPGQAFGTGNHPTTALCLELLETINVSDLKVLDAGCGSGILSIAAVKQKARLVTGVDLEAEAVCEAVQNACCNDIAANCRFLKDDIDNVKGTFDLIMANVNAEYFVLQNKVIYQLMNPGAHLIISGFLTMQMQDVVSAIMQTRPMVVNYIQHRQEWTAIHLIRRK